MSNQVITLPVPQEIQNISIKVDNTNNAYTVNATSQLGRIGVDLSSAEINIGIHPTIPRSRFDLPQHKFGPNWGRDKLLEEPLGTCIPYQPSGDATLFFTQFHSTGIVAGHYFWISDPSRFVKTTIPLLAEGCESLKYALVAFAALIFSWKRNPKAKVFAFEYYRLAVDGLRTMLSTLPDRYIDVVATVLQLSTFEVPPTLPFPISINPLPLLPSHFPPPPTKKKNLPSLFVSSLISHHLSHTLC